MWIIFYRLCRDANLNRCFSVEKYLPLVLHVVFPLGLVTMNRQRS